MKLCKRGHPQEGPDADTSMRGGKRRCKPCARISRNRVRGVTCDPATGHVTHCRNGHEISYRTRRCYQCRPRGRRQPWSERVDNTPLREAALRAVAAGVPWSEIANRAGMRSGGRVDTTWLKRQLGVMSESTTSRGKRYTYHRARIGLEQAERICRALDVDPWEVGL